MNYGCTQCKDFIHFVCAGFKEETFWKMNTSSKENQACTNCKFKKATDSSTKTNTAKTPILKTSTNITDETLKDVVESVKFMSA